LESGNVAARLLAAFRMHSLGYLWEIGLHDVTMIRRPYIPGLLDSQPQPALALEPWQPIDIHSIISERRPRHAAVVAEWRMSQRNLTTETFTKIAHGPVRLIRGSIDIDEARTARKVVRKVNDIAILARTDSGARAGSHFFLNGT